MDHKIFTLDDSLKKTALRVAFRAVKQMKIGFKPRNTLRRDQNGNIISGMTQIKGRGVHYFQDFLNPTTTCFHRFVRPDDPKEEEALTPPTLYKVEAALFKFKSQVLWIDGILAEEGQSSPVEATN